MIEKLMPDVKHAMKIFDVVLDVVLVTALIPVVIQFIDSAKANLSSTEATILGLTTIVIVLGLVFALAKQTGLMKGK
jgi:hypothetical protein